MDKTVKERMKRYREKKRNERREAEEKKAKENEGARLRMVRYRGNHKIPDVCEACGYKGVTDIHHEGKEVHYLCPTCHALITRGKNTLGELLQRNTVTGEGLTKEEMGVTAYHPVLKWLIPGERRDKLEKIVTSLKRHNQLENVYLGCGRNSLPLSIVSEMLEATS